MRRLTLLALLVTAPVAAAQPVGLAAARVIDGAGNLTANGFVVVDSGRIVSVGTRPAVFRGMVYDLGDATLMPGLIDVHVHVDWHFNSAGRLHTGDDGETAAQGALAAAANAYRMLMAGFTTVQSLGAAADADVRDAIARGDLPGPRILTSMGSLNERVGTPDQLGQRVRQLKDRGAEVIKIFASRSIRDGGGPTMTLEQLRAACGEAHAVGLRAVVHAHAAEAVRLAVEAGCDQIEHGLGVTQEVLDLMAARGTYFSPQCALIFRNYLDNRQRYEGIGNYTAEGFASMERSMPQAVTVIRRALGTRGLKIVYGTDAVAGAHGHNAEDLVCRVRQAGERPMDALMAATARAAASLGAADSLGTLAPGKIADIIAVAGNPLEAIETMRRVVFVMKGGRVFRNERPGTIP